MGRDYQALNDELGKPQYDGLSDTAIVEALNDASIAYHIEPLTRDLDNYLSTTPSAKPGLTLKGCLYPVYRAYDRYPETVCAAAEGAIDLAQGQITNVNLRGNPIYAQMLAILVDFEIWTPDEADGVLNFGRRYRSRAAEMGFDTVTATDLAIVRLLPKIEAATTARATLNQQASVYDAALMQLWQGLDVELPE